MSDNAPKTPGQVYGRVDGKQYCALPEGHRTTFVTGMADMLESLPASFLKYDLAALQQSSERLNSALDYMRKLPSDQLRQVFDAYMSEDPIRQTYMVAGTFLAMLVSKSGATQSTPTVMKFTLAHNATGIRFRPRLIVQIVWTLDCLQSVGSARFSL